MRIGIDIDGVLTDVEKFTLDYGSKFCYDNGITTKINVNEYEEINIFGISKEQAIKFWNTYFGNYVLTYPVRAFAKEVIDKLKQDGNEIYIITARNEEGLQEDLYGKMQELTKQWLKKNEIYYDKIFFTPKSKLNTIIDNNIDIMIDDFPGNIKEISTKIPVLGYNAQYNANIEGKNIIRVYTWYDIYEKIKGGKLGNC